MQSNWTETTTTASDYILNKPVLATVATTGTYSSLTGTPALAPVATAGTYASLTAAPVATIYNNGTATSAVKMWSGTATTTSRVAAFYPTTNNASGGTAIFNTILNVQVTPVYATNSGAKVPYSSVYSASTSTVVADCVVNGGTAVADGTTIYCLITGT